MANSPGPKPQRSRFLIGCLAAGVIGLVIVVYLGFRAREWARGKAEEFGIRGEIQTGTVPPMVHEAVDKGDGCALLSKDEAQQLLGVPVKRAVKAPRFGTQLGCLYVSGSSPSRPSREIDLGRMVESQERHDFRDERSMRDMMEQSRKEDAQAAALQDGEGIVLSVRYTIEGSALKIRTVKITNKITNALLRRSASEQVPDITEIEQIPNLGDLALCGPGILYALRDSVFLVIDVGGAAQARQKAIAIAQKIISRI